MEKFKQYLLATAGLIVFIGATGLLNPLHVRGQGGPPPGIQGNVTVTNTPLPVTGEVTATVSGDVNVVNTPTVQANQMGTWDVKVNNGMDMPVPVEIKREELVLLREGYTVPPGKRLLIDDMSVSCSIASNFFDHFPQAPPRASAILRLVYPSDKCPEELGNENSCPSQTYSVGTAESTSVTFQTGGANSRPVVSAAAGRRMAIFADEGATLFGLCSGLVDDIPGSAISAGTGRLIDHP